MLISENTQNPKHLSPLTLAFIGDGVYEILVREKILVVGSLPPKKLHNEAVKMVRASFQGRAAMAVGEMLTEEESDILRRGRNSSVVSAPKNANVIEYRLATGLEALFGYLYLSNKQDRIKTIFEFIYENVER